MLTKKEIKGMSNVDLIHRLCSMMYPTRVYKSDITAAKKHLCRTGNQRGNRECRNPCEQVGKNIYYVKGD